MNSRALLVSAAQRSTDASSSNGGKPRPRILQRKCVCGGTPGPSGECEECRRKRLALQPKLAVNQPGDQYEQEADQVAEAIVSGAPPNRSSISSLGGGNAVPRDEPPKFNAEYKPKTEEERYKEAAKKRGEAFQKSVSDQQSADSPPIVHQVLAQSGQPLDLSTREFMEARFGYDFGKVRVHHDARADASARAVNAQAYTVGENIVFGSRHYAPGTKGGLWMLAHELTHVLQQRGRSSSTPITQPRLSLATLKLLTTPSVLVQRQDDEGAVATSGSSPAKPVAKSWSLDEAGITLRSSNVPPRCLGAAWGLKTLLISSCRAAEVCLPRGTFEFEFLFHLDAAPPSPPVPPGTTPKRVSLGAAFTSKKGATTFSRHQADANPQYVKQGAPLATILGKSFSFPTSESGTLIIQLALEVAHSGGVFNLVYQDSIPCNLVPCA